MSESDDPNGALISSEALRRAHVPAANCDWEALQNFALTFNGYEVLGSFEACAKIANDVSRKVARTGQYPNDIQVIRTCLFFEQRRWRHVTEEPDEEAWVYLRGLVAKLRSVLPE